MTKEAIEARRAYRREWARKHPENVKAQQQRYWEKKAREAAAAQTQKAAQETRPE